MSQIVMLRVEPMALPFIAVSFLMGTAALCGQALRDWTDPKTGKRWRVVWLRLVAWTPVALSA